MRWLTPSATAKTLTSAKNLGICCCKWCCKWCLGRDGKPFVNFPDKLACYSCSVAKSAAGEVQRGWFRRATRSFDIKMPTGVTCQLQLHTDRFLKKKEEPWSDMVLIQGVARFWHSGIVAPPRHCDNTHCRTVAPPRHCANTHCRTVAPLRHCSATPLRRCAFTPLRRRAVAAVHARGAVAREEHAQRARGDERADEGVVVRRLPRRSGSRLRSRAEAARCGVGVGVGIRVCVGGAARHGGQRGRHG